MEYLEAWEIIKTAASFNAEDPEVVKTAITVFEPAAKEGIELRELREFYDTHDVWGDPLDAP